MAAYVLTEIDVLDPVRYEDYKGMSPISIEAYGGRFIARGGKTVTLEGHWSPKRMVIVEFPTLERAKEWWNSPEYAEAKRLRQETAHSQMIVVDGV